MLDNPSQLMKSLPASAQVEADASGASMPLWLNLLAAIVSIGVMAWLRLVMFPNRMTPIGYGVPLILFAWLGDRRVLWACAAVFVAISAVEVFYVVPMHNPMYRTTPGYSTIALFLVIVDLLVISASVHWLINARSGLVSRNARLDTLNQELAAREEEIARQNEELQSQTEELERQTEELRVSNDELLRREKTLENLLSLVPITRRRIGPFRDDGPDLSVARQPHQRPGPGDGDSRAARG